MIGLKTPQPKLKSIMKIFYDKLNHRVLSEYNSKVAFYTEDLTCNKEVVEEVITIFNNVREGEDYVGSRSAIDVYLLDASCSQEDREIIM